MAVFIPDLHRRGAKALGEVLPALKGKLDGTAMRRPRPPTSVGRRSDLTAGRDVTVEEVNGGDARRRPKRPNVGFLAYDAEQKGIG